MRKDPYPDDARELIDREIEAREAELGRPLTAAEIEQILDDDPEPDDKPAGHGPLGEG